VDGRNPASPKRWLKPYKWDKHGYTIYLSTGAGFRNHPQYDALEFLMVIL
jgi:hypothetical protein